MHELLPWMSVSSWEGPKGLVHHKVLAGVIWLAKLRPFLYECRCLMRVPHTEQESTIWRRITCCLIGRSPRMPYGFSSDCLGRNVLQTAHSCSVICGPNYWAGSEVANMFCLFCQKAKMLEPSGLSNVQTLHHVGLAQMRIAIRLCLLSSPLLITSGSTLYCTFGLQIWRQTVPIYWLSSAVLSALLWVLIQGPSSDGEARYLAVPPSEARQRLGETWDALLFQKSQPVP